MVQAMSSLFLDNHYLRYLGWGLSDKIAEVRLTALGALGELYTDKNNHAALSAFTERFVSRIVEIAHRDIDDEVRKEAQSLVLRLFSADLLPLEELSFVDRLVSRKSPISKEGAALIFARLFGQASEEEDLTLFNVLCQYLHSITTDMSTNDKLLVTEYLVLSVETNFTLDPSKCLEMVVQSDSEFALAILEATYRRAVYPNGQTRVTPSRPSGLESSRVLTETVLDATLELLKAIASVSDLGLLSLFDMIPLFDLPATNMEAIIPAVFALFEHILTEDESLLTSAANAFGFLKNVEPLSSQVSDLLQVQFYNLLQDAISEHSSVFMAKASALTSLCRIPPSVSIDDVAGRLHRSTDETYSTHIIRLLYQELLWKLMEQKVAETPFYQQIIPLRDEIMSFHGTTIIFGLALLDIYFLFGPNQDWMPETWKFQPDQDMSVVTTIFEESNASKDDLIKAILCIARLSTIGYTNCTSLISLMLTWYGVDGVDDYIVAAIDHIQKGVGVGSITIAMAEGVIDQYQSVVESGESSETSIELAKHLVATIKKSNELSTLADSIVNLHSAFIDWIQENFTEANVDNFAIVANSYIGLLPPSAQLNIEALNSLKFSKRTENIRLYLKNLERHLNKAGKSKKLQLTPQKRRTRGTTGESRLKISHSAIVDDEEDEHESENEEDFFEEENPFVEMKESNEGSILDSPLPLRKKTIIRS